MIKTAIMDITSRCNQRCVFCLEHYRDTPPDPDIPLNEVFMHLESLAGRGAKHITFMGGETLFRRDLPEILKKARELGFTRLGLATNGTALARKGYIAELAACGLEMIEFSLHGHTEQLANAIAGTKFTYERQARALRELDDIGAIFTIVNVVVCRENREHLEDIADYVTARYPNIPARFKYKFLTLKGQELQRVESGEEPLWYGRIDAAGLGGRLSKKGIPFWFHNFPLCRLGDFAANAQEVFNIATDEQYFGLSSEGGTYEDAGRMLGGKAWPADTCGGCSLLPLCPGVEASYLALKRGAHEMRAVKKDPAPVLIAALADAGIRAAGREVENRLAVLRRIPKLSHGGPGGDYLKPLVFHCHGEPFSLQAKILAAGGRSGRGKTRPVYRLEFLGNSQRLDTEKISGFKRAAGRALSTANKLGLSIGRAYDELLAAAAGTGWHVEEELSDLLVFNSPGEPRCVDVQIAVTRGGFRKGAARKKSYGIEFRNGSELPMTERKAELVREAEKALKAAARKGLPMSGAVSATSEAAAAAEWDRRPVTPAEGTGGPTPQARQDHPPGSNRATTPAGPPPCR